MHEIRISLDIHDGNMCVMLWCVCVCVLCSEQVSEYRALGKEKRELESQLRDISASLHTYVCNSVMHNKFC